MCGLACLLQMQQGAGRAVTWPAMKNFTQRMCDASQIAFVEQ